METKFNVFEVFQIAEKIEHNNAKFYLKAAELFDDPERRDIYYKLANWRAKHEKALANRRKSFSEKTGQFGTFDPDNYVLSNPHVMASLAALTAKTGLRQGINGSGRKTADNQTCHKKGKRDHRLLPRFEGVHKGSGQRRHD